MVIQGVWWSIGVTSGYTGCLVVHRSHKWLYRVSGGPKEQLDKQCTQWTRGIGNIDMQGVWWSIGVTSGYTWRLVVYRSNRWI